MSLGWISESTFLPRKKKQIEGITSNTLINLKTQVLEQKRSRLSADLNSAARKMDVLGGRNRGVEQRIQRDAAEMRKSGSLSSKQQQQQQQQQVEMEETHSFAKLQEKAEMYEKMRRGEMEADDLGEHMVDFELKQLEHFTSQGGGGGGGYGDDYNSGDDNIDDGEDVSLFPGMGSAAAWAGRGLVSRDMRREQERQQWVESVRKEELHQSQRNVRNRVISDVARKTLEARMQVQRARQQRKLALKRRLRKIKARQEQLAQQRQ